MLNEFDDAKLVKTKLWKCYEGRYIDDGRRKWIKDVYYNAVKQLTAVRDTFSNYTLHDETHVINVMEAIAGLLGDQIDNLTVGEIELLILAACLHDIGMVYTPEDKTKWLKRTAKCDEFVRKNNPQMMGWQSEDWDDCTKQNYFRWLHPFRVSEVLGQAEWSKIFNSRPGDIVSKQTVIAVCQAHGEELEDIELTVSRARNVDVLFCAMMLRIGDLLDFDDSRAPQILYSYAEQNIKSREEWNKHQSSVGFNYSGCPSTKPLPYTAECFTPGMEHSVRSFLKWVDDELSNCRKMQNRFHDRWRSFPLPYEIDKEEIESIGYESGDFTLTMGQEQIINLLTGENLYDSNDVFVRELLQNSIDATLLRSKMEPGFQAESEEARIDLWEWYDGDGSIWFRIDDRGTGMTKGMLQRFFLKIGNSYYNSDELKRDMRDHRQEGYHAISRFGIGFLSCFLCGENAEVSTLYFDPEKSRRENGDRAATYGYGIRMSITGLTGYYVTQNQASGHTPSEPFPVPKFNKASVCEELELDNYRQIAGTSIAIRIDPGRLGGINLREAVQKYLCCPRMPVYYNGERIGETYREFMEKAHDAAGTYCYEFSDENKAQVDEILQGHYPQIAVTVMPFDLTKNHILEGLSGVAVKYDLIYDEEFWKEHRITPNLRRDGNSLFISFDAYHYYNNNFKKYFMDHKFDMNKDITLRIKLDDAIYHLISYVTSKTLSSELFEDEGFVCAYHGIFAGPLGEISCNKAGDCMAIYFLEDAQQPKVDVGRTKISALHLSSVSAICALLHQLDTHAELVAGMQFHHSLTEWRELRKTPLGGWLLEVLNCSILNPQDASLFLQKMKYSISKGEFLNEYGITIAEIDGEMVNLNFILAYFQDTYELTIDYMQEQAITFSNKEKSERITQYDLFPPMMFCKAKDDNSRRYLCGKETHYRKGITADHPYTIWLLSNASILNRHFNRQFKQIVNSLCNEEADAVIQTLNMIRDQLRPISVTYGIDMGLCPELTEEDFWEQPDKPYGQLPPLAVTTIQKS